MHEQSRTEAGMPRQGNVSDAVAEVTRAALTLSTCLQAMVTRLWRRRECPSRPCPPSWRTATHASAHRPPCLPRRTARMETSPPVQWEGIGSGKIVTHKFDRRLDSKSPSLCYACLSATGSVYSMQNDTQVDWRCTHSVSGKVARLHVIKGARMVPGAGTGAERS